MATLKNIKDLLKDQSRTLLLAFFAILLLAMIMATIWVHTDDTNYTECRIVWVKDYVSSNGVETLTWQGKWMSPPEYAYKQFDKARESLPYSPPMDTDIPFKLQCK